MMNWNKQIYALILLLSLVLPCGGIIVWFQGQLYSASEAAQSVIQNNLKTEEHIVLKFSSEEAGQILRWEHPHEFEFEGEMYDVIQSNVLEDSVLYYCYHDVRETTLQGKFKSFVINFLTNQHPAKKQNQQISDYFKSVYFKADVQSLIIAFQLLKQGNFKPVLRMESNFLRDPSVPPPRLLC